MEPRTNDILLELQLDSESALDTSALLEAFDGIENALYASDRRDIEQARLELKIPPVVGDASLERLRQYRHHRLILVDARAGSLVFMGVVVGVAYFVLQKTIGDAFADGFKQSQSYQRLREFFTRSIDQKALFIAEAMRRVFASKRRNARVTVFPKTRDEPNRIQVSLGLRLPSRKVPGSLAEELDKEP